MNTLNTASFFVLLFIQTVPGYASLIVDSATPIHDSFGVSYGASNLVDKNRLTAFCVSDNAMMWLKIKNRGLSGFGIINGYDKSNSLFKDNSRPKDVVIRINDKQKLITLKDGNIPQWISLWDDSGGNGTIKLSVRSNYAGKKYHDVCISELIADPIEFELYKILMSGKDLSSKFSPDQINIEHNSKALLNAFIIFTSRYDKDSLSILLRTIDYSDRGSVYNSELNEGLKSIVVKFIKNKSDIALEVLADSHQVGRNYIVDSWVDIIGFSKYDTNQDVINDPDSDPAMRRFAIEIKKYLKEEQ